MKVLVADDDQGVLIALELLLRRAGITVACVQKPEDALAAAAAQPFDLFVLDLNYAKDTTSGGEGLSLLSRLRERCPRTPAVVMTGWASIEGAVEAMRRGATDYISKPWDNDRLLALVRKLDPAAGPRERAAAIDLGESSPAMREVIETVELVAFSDIAVLITGEHGTGKEVIARLIHARSRRRGAFVAVNAGGLPDGVLESELFGHVRGAFTDAKADRRGAFAEAEEGTVFLDEITNMPPQQQAKLLRVLQDKAYRPLGSSAVQVSTARVVSATNADITEEVRSGRFRADLLYRLNTIHLRLPPLRDRRPQIPGLAQRFIDEAASRYGLAAPELDAAALEDLSAHDWPGNVRELEHALQRAVLLSAASRRITSAHLALPSSLDRPATSKLKEAERDLIVRAIERHPGDKVAAAKSLGLSRSAFYRRVQQFGIKLS